MTALEAKAIQLYLADLEVDEVEFYNELYDHIATAYGDRADQSLGIQEFLEVVMPPRFGGEQGILVEIQRQRRFVRKGIYKEALRNYISFFSTPVGLLKSTLLLGIILLLNEMRFSKSSISTLLVLASCLPFLISNIVSWRFKLKCKKQKLPFYSSYTNQMVVILTAFFVGVVQGLPDITSRILYGEHFSLLKTIETNTTMLSIVTFLVIIYGWVCLEIIWRKTTINKKITSKLITQP
ncbi:hypothetical protein EV198_0095 [Roseivirga ehrenbergii]|uniref:Uncharacterized protein n=1 Tax=Roseivirga ehrenbergii (strain DSM 102268 / JCM 13514 / KCTC 12282 / NCIMB 14502 / KMM 6017) TaxID=279360 RepID=A0A150WZY3_ROSEK|nr:hypothetical protein [Roseivirga ehrenbergii]KYG72050.1 hypothetical protein MB14_08320 [Roseivirga ehrenbergii]TCL13273.1 hypothetical protein EV198_0095 [Roseivirga ehrenbergii]